MKTRLEISGTSFFPPSPGRVCTVRGYYTGDFIGRVESADRCVVVLTVLDAPQQMFRSKDRCSFPGCSLKDMHDGQHYLKEFSTLLIGQQVEVSWKLARFELHPVNAKRNNVLEFPSSRGAA